ncbi:MAG TPA: hypothetical protein ENI60_02915, partial [Candidatus Fraserbacteria bacterium]|nr:hypothetical protein [Candidatus Fraserbacteria bacterium]
SRYPECKSTVDLPQGVPFHYLERQLIVGEHLAAHQEQKAQSAQELSAMPCPKCGAPMVLKEGKFGRFYGCSAYPKCKTTRPISTGVPCPRCGKEIVERYSRKRRQVFYSCSGYPDCKFLVGAKPDKLCPDCEEGVLIAGKEPDLLVCSSKKCAHQEAASPLPEALAAEAG